jgi:two-component system, OmpR family, phosphate regulon sensor histidine kinase PhoR
MRLATRYFATMSLLLGAAAVGLILAADRVLRRELEAAMATELEHQARGIATLLPADSSRWPELARELGRRVGRRVTLISPGGVVLGDSEFDRAALPRLENHATRPEVVAALAQGAGRDRRLSASTNEPQLYVGVRGGPPGLGVVRVSATLAAVDAQIHATQRALAVAGLAALLAAGFAAWIASRVLARPLVQLTGAARAIATGSAPRFPESRVPEIAEHALTLRAMHEELTQRFDALQRGREESDAILTSLADGVIAADGRGEIVACNPAARRLLGYAADAPLPALSELFHDKAARDLVKDILDGRDVDDRELELDGRALLVTGRMVADGRTLVVLHDVTRLRRLEAVRRDFVANVSHELKTPLTSIAGYAETLSHEVENGEARRFAETILSNARRMQRLVDELLDLSKIEAGAWKPNVQTVDVKDAATEAWAPFAEAAVGQRVVMEVAVAKAVVAVDPEALGQILANLFENALRHTPPGGTITVDTAPATGGVTLRVRDTGSGIPQEHLPRIFERFYRVDAARSRAQGGTGLGLAIVKHLVEAHGGRVWAESTVGRGTTMHVFFRGGGA